jgi:hypothetical protein
MNLPGSAVTFDRPIQEQFGCGVHLFVSRS